MDTRQHEMIMQKLSNMEMLLARLIEIFEEENETIENEEEDDKPVKIKDRNER